LARLYGATTALACIMALALAGTVPVEAQNFGPFQTGTGKPGDKQMLLEADTLIFNRDKDTVTASGGVKIEYQGNRLVADQVTYDRSTKRVLAHGHVEMIDPKGTRTFADNVDVTDDFRDGFSNALRVEATNKTYFGADTGERAGGAVTTFTHGIYTACAPCEKKPNRPPIWRVRAQKIIWNGQSKTVRFLHSRFELFGMPIAYFPSFEVPDPTVKRKSGLLLPTYSFKDELGFGATLPYYLVLSPTTDLTLFPTYYSKQGFASSALFRQKFNNGEYSVTVSGIRQQDPEAFKIGYVDRGTDDDPNRWRGMVGTKGTFHINPRWTFGWDILAQTDKDYAYTYNINGYNTYRYHSQIYLTGINDKNYFDLRAYHFSIQEPYFNSNANGVNKLQPWVLPSFDYSYTPDEPVAGGQLTFDVNAQSLIRDNLDVYPLFNTDGSYDFDKVARIGGIDGSDQRLTAKAEWKRSLVTDQGLVITPILGARLDGIRADYNDDSIDAINGMATNRGVDADIRSAYYRYMATAGMEVRWPILFSTTSASQVIEPVAQIFVRPNEPYAGSLGIPNEDAQSMVFDASSLFEEDKFSGYDRIEGGTRANVGLRYSGSFAGGWSANGIFGQSYQLAGLNSYATPDLVNVGAYSGLQTARSDYVGQVGLTSPNGFTFMAGGRFDKDSFEARRLEAAAVYSSKPFSVSARYAFIQAQPLYGFDRDRREITATASTRFARYWSAFGSSTYDMSYGVLVSDAVGISYLDDCFGFTFAYAQTRNAETKEVKNNIGFTLSFRTLGDFGSDTSKFQKTE
jgi:LPS-assembly protein